MGEGDREWRYWQISGLISKTAFCINIRDSMVMEHFQSTINTRESQDYLEMQRVVYVQCSVNCMQMQCHAQSKPVCLYLWTGQVSRGYKVYLYISTASASKGSSSSSPPHSCILS